MAVNSVSATPNLLAQTVEVTVSSDQNLGLTASALGWKVFEEQALGLQSAQIA